MHVHICMSIQSTCCLAMFATSMCESVNLRTVHSMCSIMPFVLPSPQNSSVVKSDRPLVQSTDFMFRNI